MKKKNSVILSIGNEKVRRYWDQEKEEGYFSVIDVIAILTDSAIPKRYWSGLKRKFKKEGSEVYEYIVQLKLLASDGKRYATVYFISKLNPLQKDTLPILEVPMECYSYEHMFDTSYFYING